MVTPLGALAPVAGEPGGMAPGANAWSVRYGRWRYDAADAVHDTGGLMWTHSFALARTQLALTGAYGLVECPTCSGWLMGGVDVQSTLWSRGVSASAAGRPILAAAGARLSVGGGRYRGRDPVNAFSAAVTMPLEISVPFKMTAAVRASVIPGLTFGRIASAGSVASGILPVIGGAIAWTVNSALEVNLGMQCVVLAGGAIQIGTALTWRRGAHANAHTEARP